MTQPSALVIPGKRGTSTDFEPDLAHQGARMQGTAAAKGHEGEFRRIMPALDGYEADGPGHSGIRDLDDRLRRARRVEAERTSDMGQDGLRRRFDIETCELVADGAFRIDAAKHHIGVGQRRARVAAAIAGRPRQGARAFRSHLEEATLVDARDRAAARSDGRDLDHGRADDEAEIDGGLGRERGVSISDQ